MLMNWIMDYGCCFNTIIGEFIGRRYDYSADTCTHIMSLCLSICTATYFMNRLIMQFLLETYTVYVEYHLEDFVLRYNSKLTLIMYACCVCFALDKPIIIYYCC